MKTINPKKITLSTLVGILLFGLVWAADTLTSVRLPQSDHPAELYSNQTGDNLQKTFLTSIYGAKKSILLIIYALNDRHVIEALKQQAEAGIKVKVICDSKASAQAERKLGPKVETIRRSSPGLMHQKIMVIDDQECWIGSANMTTDSLRMHGNLVSAMDHAEIATMINEKSQGMGQRGKSEPVLHRDFMLDQQRVELWFLPDNTDALASLIKLMRTATKTIRIAMFTWTHPLLTQEVINAHKRGIDVEVVVDNYAGKGAGAEVVKKLSDNGIPVHLSPGGALLHHKFMSIDGNLLVNGSANWTRAAFTQNDDCFIILHDLTDEQRDKMEKLWKIIWSESIAQ